jgi:hypothetical protein
MLFTNASRGERDELRRARSHSANTEYRAKIDLASGQLTRFNDDI